MEESTTQERERILSTCLDRIASGEWSVRDCLEAYPEEAAGMQELLTLAVMLRQTGEQIAPRAAYRRGATSRLLSRLEDSARPPAGAMVTDALTTGTLWDRVEERLAGFLRGGRVAFAGAALVLLLAVFSLGGLVSVADAAGPGDPLYDLDLAVESARVRLTSDPAQLATLRLSFADERLEEADKLAREEDQESFERAIFGYGAEVAAVTEAVNEGAVTDGSTLDLVGRAIAGQEERLTTIFATATGADHGKAASGIVCDTESAGLTHPVAASLVSQYDVSEAQVVSWFCAGYPFGQILLALTTAQETDFTVTELLEAKSRLGGWGQVWQTMDEGFPGPPDGAGLGDEPPLLGDEPPGLDDEPPGLGDEPPGLGDEPPGLGDEPPGLGDEPPGRGDDPPGRGDDPPGRGDDPPGRGDDPPSRGDDPPSRGDDPPGRGDDPPGGGQQEEPPGGGQQEEPSGGGQQEEPPGGGQPPESPGGGPPKEPGGGRP